MEKSTTPSGNVNQWLLDLQDQHDSQKKLESLETYCSQQKLGSLLNNLTRYYDIEVVAEGQKRWVEARSLREFLANTTLDQRSKDEFCSKRDQHWSNAERFGAVIQDRLQKS